jgi:hypothetical protein
MFHRIAKIAMVDFESLASATWQIIWQWLKMEAHVQRLNEIHRELWVTAQQQTYDMRTSLQNR